jgi:iron complex transport system substrate-binding protein
VLAVILVVLIVSGSAYGVFNVLTTSQPSASPSVNSSPTPSTQVPTSSPQETTEPTSTASPSPSTQKRNVTVVDGLGRQVNVAVPCERIITLDPGLTEIVCLLGGADKIVGVDSEGPGMVIYPSILKDVPVVGYTVEAIVDLQPDLIISGAALDYYQEKREQLEAAGISIYITSGVDQAADPYSNATVVDTSCRLVTTIAELLGAEETAVNYVNYVQHYNNLVKERIANLTRQEMPLVLLEWSSPYYTSVINYQNSVGAINIAENETLFYIQLSAEYVVSANPDIIICAISSPGHNEADFVAMRDQILNRPELSDVNAVKNGNVFIYDYVVIREGVGAHEVVGYLYWAKWCHPDLFADIDPAAVNSELNQLFFGKDETGTYVYPPCSSTSVPTSVTVTDDTGTNVTIPFPVNRIVCFNGAVTEMICAMGGEDKIVGILGSSISFPKSVLDKTSVGTSTASIPSSLETVFSLAPDLIIADDAIYNYNETVNQIKNAGIPLYIDRPGIPARVSTIVTNIGLILGNSSMAEKINNNTQYYTNLVEQRVQTVPDSELATYYCEWGKAWFSSTGGIVPSIMTKCNGINIAANSTVKYPTLSAEYVATANPDVIVIQVPVIGNNLTVYQLARDELMSRVALSGTTAVQEGRVYVYNPYLTSGIEAPVGELYFAKWLYPDLFEDIDPGAIYVQLIQEYFGITPEGVYAYP